jgi:hypothetical protein
MSRRVLIRWRMAGFGHLSHFRLAPGRDVRDPTRPVRIERTPSAQDFSQSDAEEGCAMAQAALYSTLLHGGLL